MSADHPQDGDSTENHPTTVSNAAFAEHLDFDLDDAEADPDELAALVEQLENRDIDPLVATLLESLVEMTSQLHDRVEELESDQEQTHDIATTAVGKAETNAVEIGELDERETRSRDIAKSAIAKAQQLEADSDRQEDAERLPEGIEPSTSPLDFFANARQSKVKELFVEQDNKANTYRAIAIAKRWPEFATERTDSGGVFLTKDDITTALTAELGREPHRQTVARVWEKVVELGGQDVVAKTRQVGRDQTRTEILAIDKATAEGLLEKRYVGLDLLDEGAQKATIGGVTPVVTGDSAEAP